MKLQNEEYEQILLGHIINHNDVLEDFRIFDDLFTVKKNKDIFQAILKLKEEGYDIDKISVTDKSKVDASYVSELPFYSGNTKYYYDELLELSKKRKLYKVAAYIMNGISEDYNTLISGVEKSIESIDYEVGDIVYIKDLLAGAIEDIESIYNGTKDFGLKLNTAPLDNYIVGLTGNKLVILGARTSVGKTAYMLQISLNLALSGVKCGIISLEMTKLEITNRLLSNLSMVDLNKIRFAKKTDFDNLDTAANKLYKTNIMIADPPRIYLNDLRVMVRKMIKEGAQIIFIDYLTMIRHDNQNMARHEQVGEISKTLKELSRQHDIPIICLSQVKRDAENRQPGLSDLNWSREIEQDADIVILLHGDRNEERLHVYVAKNRGGAIGGGDVLFRKEHQRFYEYT